MKFLKRFQTAILLTILVVFVLSFPAMYYGGYLQRRLDTAAEINDEKISYQHFSTVYNQVVNRKRDSKEELNPEALKRLKQEVMQSLVQEAVFFQEAGRYGFQVSDQELALNLASIPAFQKDGKFSASAYLNALQSYLRTSPEEFEESQRRQILISHLRAFIMQGIKITDREVDLEMAIRTVGRDPKKKYPPVDREEVRKQMAQEKGAHILNRWYQHLGSNVKLRVNLDEIEKRGG